MKVQEVTLYLSYHWKNSTKIQATVRWSYVTRYKKFAICKIGRVKYINCYLHIASQPRPTQNVAKNSKVIECIELIRPFIPSYICCRSVKMRCTPNRIIQYFISVTVWNKSNKSNNNTPRQNFIPFIPIITWKFIDFIRWT